MSRKIFQNREKSLYKVEQKLKNKKRFVQNKNENIDKVKIKR